VLLAVLAGGCSDSSPQASGPSTTARQVDTREVEQLLVAAQKRASPDLNVGAASCPEQVPVTDGASFQCTVLVEGVVAPYTVTLVNVNAQNRTGRFDLRPAKAIVLVPKVAEYVKSVATDPTARVDCGTARVLILDTGATLDCQLTDSRGPHPVRVRVEDEHGRVSVVAVG
jgi:hypothetical protein